MNLRREAKGRDCQIRLPGVCNFNPETTVLCHYRLTGISGMGMKSPDLFGAWGCSACHDAVDGRAPTAIPRDKLLRYHLEGVVRTQAALLSEGKIRA